MHGNDKSLVWITADHTHIQDCCNIEIPTLAPVLNSPASNAVSDSAYGVASLDTRSIFAFGIPDAANYAKATATLDGVALQDLRWSITPQSNNSVKLHQNQNAAATFELFSQTDAWLSGGTATINHTLKACLNDYPDFSFATANVKTIPFDIDVPNKQFIVSKSSNNATLKLTDTSQTLGGSVSWTIDKNNAINGTGTSINFNPSLFQVGEYTVTAKLNTHPHITDTIQVQVINALIQVSHNFMIFREGRQKVRVLFSADELASYILGDVEVGEDPPLPPPPDDDDVFIYFDNTPNPLLKQIKSN